MEKIIGPNLKKIITETTSYGRKRIRVQTENTGPSKTDQSFKDDCDVNLILKRFMKTGQRLPQVTGKYNDISEVPNLADALTQLNEAQHAFDNLPSFVRKRFGNSPVELVNFLKDPQNFEEGVKLGLLKKRPVPVSTEPDGSKRSALAGDEKPIKKTKEKEKEAP